MSNGNGIWIFGLMIVFAAVGIPLIIAAIRTKDFKDQVSGKKPERKVKPNRPENYDGEKPFDVKMESDAFIARTKTFQNIMGPK